MIKMAIACVTLITSIAIAMVGLDSFFARKDVNSQEHTTLKKKTMLVDMRLQQQIYYDKIDREESILRDYEEQYGDDCVNAPASKRAKCDRAKREIKNAEKAVENIPEMVKETY